MQSDALNKKILCDQFEKSEPHAIELIKYFKQSKHRKARAPRKNLSLTASMTPMALLLV